MLVCVVIFIIFKANTFRIAGNVELNPGLHELLNSVQGSFTQGNIYMLRVTAGRQCACSAMFVICWSFIRKLNCWEPIDLDHILIEDEKIYKSLNQVRAN